MRSMSPPARAACPPRLSMKLWPPPPVDAASVEACGPLLFASVTRLETVPVSPVASIAASCCAGVSPSTGEPALLVVSVTRFETVPSSVEACGPLLVASVRNAPDSPAIACGPLLVASVTRLETVPASAAGPLLVVSVTNAAVVPPPPPLSLSGFAGIAPATPAPIPAAVVAATVRMAIRSRSPCASTSGSSNIRASSSALKAKVTSSPVVDPSSFSRSAGSHETVMRCSASRSPSRTRATRRKNSEVVPASSASSISERGTWVAITLSPSSSAAGSTSAAFAVSAVNWHLLLSRAARCGAQPLDGSGHLDLPTSCGKTQSFRPALELEQGRVGIDDVRALRVGLEPVDDERVDAQRLVQRRAAPDRRPPANAERLQARLSVDPELVPPDRAGIRLLSHLVAERYAEAGRVDCAARDRDSRRSEGSAHQHADETRDGHAGDEKVDGLLPCVVDVGADV